MSRAVFLGSADGRVVSVGAADVSAHHAVLRPLSDRRLLLTDLGAPDGLRVSRFNRPVEQAVVRLDDTVSIGGHSYPVGDLLTLGSAAQEPSVAVSEQAAGGERRYTTYTGPALGADGAFGLGWLEVTIALLAFGLGVLFASAHAPRLCLGLFCVFALGVVRAYHSRCEQRIRQWGQMTGSALIARDAGVSVSLMYWCALGAFVVQRRRRRSGQRAALCPAIGCGCCHGELHEHGAGEAAERVELDPGHRSAVHGVGVSGAAR